MMKKALVFFVAGLLATRFCYAENLSVGPTGILLTPGAGFVNFPVDKFRSEGLTINFGNVANRVPILNSSGFLPAANLPNVGTAGTYGDSTHVPQVVLDAKGRVTGVSLISIAATLTATAPIVITGSVISIPVATTTINGYLSATDWNTFNNKISAITVTANNGITQSVTSGSITLGLGAITPSSVSSSGNITGVGLITSTGSSAGFLFTEEDASGTDWIGYSKTGIFRLYNGSDLLTLGATGNLNVLGTVTGSNLSGSNTGDQTITLTGDATGGGTGSFGVTLAIVNSNTGSFGDSSHIGQFTANAKGLITAASSVAISPSAIGAEVPLTFSTGLTRTSNTITVNSIQTFSLLTMSGISNGILFTERNATGADWAAYSTSGVFRLNNGADRFTVDASGNITANNLSSTNTGDVSLAGQTYLSIAGQVITANAINLGGTNVTGVLLGTNGGTGVNNGAKTLTLGASLATTGTASTAFALPSSGTPTYTFPVASQTIASLAGGEAFTNKDLTGAGNTFPTFNQNTTGSAAKWTTPRTLADNSVDGSTNVAFANKFVVQGTSDSGLSAAQFLGALGTGIVKNTTTTGVLSIASSGTDYELPLTFTSPISRVTNAISMPRAAIGTSGYLHGDDFNVFNSKQDALPTGGTTAQYLRGNLTLGTLNQAAVAGLTSADAPVFSVIGVASHTSTPLFGVGGDWNFYSNGGILRFYNGSDMFTLDGSGNMAATNFSGSSSGSNTGDQTTVSGNAGTATVLQTARLINGVSFNGSANITVTVTSAQIATALGFTPLATNGNGSSLTGLTASQIPATLNGTIFSGNTFVAPSSGTVLLGIQAANFGSTSTAVYLQFNNTTRVASLFGQNTGQLDLSTNGATPITISPFGTTRAFFNSDGSVNFGTSASSLGAGNVSVAGTLNVTGAFTAGSFTNSGDFNIAAGHNLTQSGATVLRLSDNVSTVINPVTTGGSIYLNWDRGTSFGTVFGDGATNVVGRVDLTGNANFGDHTIGVQHATNFSPNVVFEGDSITQQVQCLGNSSCSGGTPNGYNNYMGAAAGANPDAQGHNSNFTAAAIGTVNGISVSPSVGQNVAVAGKQSWELLETSYRVNKLYRQEALNVLVYLAGTNDMGLGSYSYQQTYEQIAASLKHFRAMGWKIVLVGLISRGDGVVSDASINAVNGLLRQNAPQIADRFVDWQVVGSGTNEFYNTAGGGSGGGTWYNSDRLHPSYAGSRKLASYVAPYVNDLLTYYFQPQIGQAYVRSTTASHANDYHAGMFTLQNDNPTGTGQNQFNFVYNNAGTYSTKSNIRGSGAGDLNIGSTGYIALVVHPSGPDGTDIYAATGNTDTGERFYAYTDRIESMRPFRITSNSGAGFTAGKGLNLNYSSGTDTATIQSYDNTTPAWKPMYFGGSQFRFAPSGTINLSLDSNLTFTTSGVNYFGITQTGTGGKQWQLYSTNSAFGQGAGKFLIYNGSDNVTVATFDANANLVIGGHFGSNQTAPSIVKGANAGSTASVAFGTNSTDSSGLISITPSAGCTAGTMATVTFNTAYANSPHVVLGSASNATAVMQPYYSDNSTTFAVWFVGTPTASTTYVVSYHVQGQ